MYRNITVIGVAAAIVSALAAGCGGGGSPKATPTSTPVSEAEFAAKAREAVNAALITLDDLPDGWYASASGDASDDDDFPIEFDGECAELTSAFADDTVAYPGSITEDTSDVFVSDALAQMTEDVSSDAGVYRTAAEARDRQEHFDGLYARCDDAMSMALEKAAYETPGILDANVNVKFRPNTGSLGDQSATATVSFSATGEGGAIAFVSETVEVRVGRVIGSLTYTNSGAMTQEIADDLAATLVERLTAADRMLPE